MQEGQEPANDLAVASEAIARRNLEWDSLPASGPGSLSYLMCADRLQMSYEDVVDLESSINDYVKRIRAINPFMAGTPGERNALKRNLRSILTHMSSAHKELMDIVEVELQDLAEQTKVHWGDHAD